MARIQPFHDGQDAQTGMDLALGIILAGVWKAER
jgi:hypothetical protein